MGKSYSIDLRLRVLGAIDNGVSKIQAHRIYKMSRSTIDDWLKLREERGSVEVVPSRAGRKGLRHHPGFAAFAQCHRHSTLGQMKAAWHEETGQDLSLMSFWQALRGMGYTRKKELSRPRALRARALRAGTRGVQATNRADSAL